jgi:hypothetical protein
MEQAGSAAAGGGRAGSGPRGWWRILAIAIGLLAVLAAAFTFLRSRDWAAAEHARNYRELTLVAKAIEAWPVTVDRMARAHLLPERLEPPPDARKREGGWQAAVRIQHPEVGPITIHYRLADSSFPNCVDRTLTRAWIGGMGGRLRLMGEISLPALWYDDQGLVQPLSDIRRPGWQDISDMLAVIGERRPKSPGVDPPQSFFATEDVLVEDTWVPQTVFGEEFDKPGDERCPVLDYEASVPIERIAQQDSNAAALAAILVIDRDGDVIATLGRGPPPVANISQLIQQDDAYQQAFAALVSAAARDKGGPPDKEVLRRDAVEAWLSGKPLEVKAGGESYVSYIRGLELATLPGVTLNASDCRQPERVEQTGGEPATERETKPDASEEQDAGRILEYQCALIGLVRTSDINQRSFSLAPDVLMSALLLVALVIVLVPVLKLRFLGSAGALAPAEVLAAGFGILAAAAFVTLAFILLVRQTVDHARATDGLVRTANAMATQFESELSFLTRRSIWVPLEPDQVIPVPSPGVLGPVCRRGDRTEDIPQASPPAGVGSDLVRLADPAGDRAARPWPTRHSVVFYGELGFTFPGTRMLVQRCNSGGRVDIAERGYRSKMLSREFFGNFPEVVADGGQKLPCSGVWGLGISRGYGIEGVRVRTDGTPAILVTSRLRRLRDGEAPGAEELPRCRGVASAKLLPGPPTGVAVQAAIFRSLLAPVLAPGQQFIVVDARQADLPMLFGTQAGRIGIDYLGPALDSADAREAIGRARRSVEMLDRKDRALSAEPQPFTLGYEGVPQRFVARGLPGSPFVLLVHEPLDRVDGLHARTASLAAMAWLGLMLPGSLLMLGVWAIWRRRAWTWLWPAAGMGAAARRAGQLIMALAGFGLLALLLASIARNETLAGALALVLLVAVPATSLFLAWRALRQGTPGSGLLGAIDHWLRPPESEPAGEARARPLLRPRDERGYRLLFLSLILALGMATMAATWADGFADSRRRMAAADLGEMADALRAYRSALDAQIRSFRLDAVGLAPGLTLADGDSKLGLPALRQGKNPPATEPTGLLHFTGLIRKWVGEGPSPQVRTCAERAVNAERACLGTGGQLSLLSEPEQRVWPSPPVIAGALALAGLLLLLLRFCLGAIERGLFGFGVPIEAVEFPGIAGTAHDLPERSVVLNGPMALQLALIGLNDPFDLGHSMRVDDAKDPRLGPATTALADGKVVVAVGLDVALKDPALRRAALDILEQLSATVDRDRRARSGASAGRLVVLTDLSPLDRVLQAYEREQGREGDQGIGPTEQLRWSRLFEDFTTFSLPPTPRIRWSAQRIAELRRELADRPPGEIDGILTLIAEMEWLPEQAIDSVLAPGDAPTPADWRALEAKRFPLSCDQFDQVYFERVKRWAKSVRPVSPAAAVDFLRGILIEHYQHAWAASSHAERIILDALARRRMVNLEAALAIRSLVRRGLVVMTPDPRLMNQSFAAFVRQAERPDTIAEYRREQGGSFWDRLARPIAFVIPALLGLVSTAAVLSGADAATMLPVLLSAGPALLGAIGANLKPRA